MCNVVKAQQTFDAWLIPTKHIELARTVSCEDGCDPRFYSTPGEHPDHELQVTIDMPICFSDCMGLTTCDCWWSLWEDLSWIDTKGPIIANDLGAEQLLDFDIDIVDDSFFVITYVSLTCPPNPLKVSSATPKGTVQKVKATILS